MSIPALPFKVKTTVSWAGEEEGDLGFIENEIIEVYSIVDESWWSGKLRRNKAEGIFPKDYVKVLEQTSKGNSLSNTPTKQNTPVKDHDYRNSKNTTPVKANGFHSAKLLPKKHYPQDSYDEFSFDNSYENLEKMNRSHRKKSSKPSHEDYMTKQMEIEKFKMLQQQHNYHIKKAAELDRQKRYLQQDFGRNSIGNMPESPTSRSKLYNSGAKFRPASMHFDQFNRQSSTPNFKGQMFDTSNGPPQGVGSNMFNNHTIESFSPEASPKQKKMSSKLPYRGLNMDNHDELDEIALKKKQLEMELLQLEELQKSTMQMKRVQNNKVPTSPNKMMEHSNDSYVSEDLASSKKNYHSREDLSKKLSRYQTDDEINVYEYDQGYGTHSDSHSPPPPPPKHRSPMQNLETLEADDTGHYDDDDVQVIDEMPQYGSRQNLQKSAHESPQYQLQNKIPYDADDFRFSGNNSKVILTEEEFLRLSQVQQEELKNSIKSLQSDVLNLSELSATSAGSFLRHRYEREYQAEQEMRMKNLSLDDNSSKPTELNGQAQENDSKHLMDSIFQDKKSKHPNIFKKLLKKKEEVTNPLEQRMQQDEGAKEIDWTTFKLELNRANTLTSLDKQSRTKRVVRQDQNMIVKPFDYLSEINTNETLNDDYEPLSFPRGCFEKVDSFLSRYPTDTDLNDLISDIGIKFNSSKVNQLRAVLMHFIKFTIIEETGKIQQIKPKLNDLLRSGEGSIFQLNYLFKKVLDALRIPSEIVLGFWKKPNEFYHDDQYIINHCWLSVLAENQFFIVDLLNFKDANICNIRDSRYNEFYFLSKPLTLVSTHIPSIIDLQHVIPPLDQNISFHLPRLYSGYHKNGLQFRNFNNALTKLNDLEFFEMDLEVPIDVELFTLIKTGKVTSNEYSLCQIYWNNNKRYAKIKAVLPESENIGVLQIFAGEKGLQKHFNNIHELAVVIPLYHEGENKPIKFVPRYPTVQSQSNDLYVKAPQTNKIIIKNSYNFNILQYPSCGITNSSKYLNQDFKLVIESPSGKYLKLEKTEPGKPYGSYENLIKVQELGLYRGLVIGDSGNSWYVFAQWECTPGTVT